MIKQIKVAVIFLLGVFVLTPAFADKIPVKILLKCSGMGGHSMDYPVKNGEVYLTMVSGGSKQFYSTDDQGIIYLSDRYANQQVMGYLAASNKAIYAGCRSDLTPTSQGTLILGAPGSICPQDYCNFGHSDQ